MKNKAFTLIEVLVVVLIIGILAAISVVQYQKSVLKSRFTALMPIAKALYEGNELFAMSSGKYTDKLENLDISTTGGASGSTANINGSIVTLGVNNRHTYVKATRENFDNNLIMFQKGSRYFPGEIHCEAKEDKTLANWLCEKELGGIKLDRSLTEGYTDYVINGDGNGFFPKDFVDGTNGETLMPGDTCTATEAATCVYVKGYNNNVCIGNGTRSCIRGTFENSTCQANAERACIRSTFKNSVCEGNKLTTCTLSNLTNSTCWGYGWSACAGSTYSQNSYCFGNNEYACSGSTFKDNSICYANVKHSCGTSSGAENGNNTITESVYQGNACCLGEFCPASAPKCACGIDSNTGQHALSC